MGVVKVEVKKDLNLNFEGFGAEVCEKIRNGQRNGPFTKNRSSFEDAVMGLLARDFCSPQNQLNGCFGSYLANSSGERAISSVW